MEKLPDPKTIVDSIGNGVVGAAQVLPRAAENIAGVAHAYAGSVNRSIDEFKAKMPDEPAVIPRMIGSIAGETLGAVVGLVEAVVRAGSATVTDIKSQIDRGTR